MEKTLQLLLVIAMAAALGLGGCGTVPTTAPAPSPTAGSEPQVATRAFDVVAAGAPMVAPDDARPLMVALRAGSPAPALLPDEARQALTKAVGVQDDALYLVVYVGRQPSAGYGVRIVSVAQRVEGGVAKLAVTYLIDPPDPTKGNATVITHPYVIARVRGVSVDPANVTFQPQ